MPQNRHCRFRLRFSAIRSLSGPVDVMTPLDVVPIRPVESEPPGPLLLLFVELQPIPDVGDGEAREFVELPLLLLLFVLLRDARLLALALMRRFKSSLSSDLSGETWTEDGRWTDRKRER